MLYLKESLMIEKKEKKSHASADRRIHLTMMDVWDLWHCWNSYNLCDAVRVVTEKD